MHASFVRAAREPISLYAVSSADLKSFLAKIDKRSARFLTESGFRAASADMRLVPDAQGKLRAAVLGLGDDRDKLALAAFPEQLPAGNYQLKFRSGGGPGELDLLAWAFGTYAYARYRKQKKTGARLLMPSGADVEEASRIAEAVFLARDLINTPPNAMGPAELAGAVQDLARRHRAKFSLVLGEALLKQNYPLIHAVGMGSVRAPRLAGLVWGREGAPRVTLVGKGVCFDTGGYDLKPASGMAAMKKDMGGAACVLAIADMVMGAKLDLRLRVLIPAVENSVSGNAYRPSDVFPSRKGLTVEIGNTDAEGRLVLADALAEADSESPELLVDVATLTGAARVATGFELPPFFTDDEGLARELMEHSERTQDPMWRMPLWRGYESALASAVADLNNNPDYAYAGAITAALFLNRFVSRARSWLHFDIAAWSDRPKPGRRKGGEPNVARAVYSLLKARFGSRGR